MRKLLVIILMLVMASPAHAWLAQVPAGGGASYTGPGDVVASAVDWWGLRAYNASQATALVAAVQICTASDALCTDIHVTATGGLNASDITTSGCGSITTCTVKTLYDQAGAHNCTQATIANRFTFNPNGVSSGKPSMHANGGGSQTMSCSGISTTAVPWTITLVMKPDVAGGGYNRILIFTDPVGILFSPGANFAVVGVGGGSGNSTVTTNNSTFYSVVGRTDGTGGGGIINVSGTTTSGLSPGGNSLTSPMDISPSAAGGMLNCDYVEMGFWGSGFASGSMGAMNSNQQTYWGI